MLTTKAVEAGKPLPDTLVFDEAADVASVRHFMEGTTVVSSEFVVPEQPSSRSETVVESVVACLSLGAKDIQIDTHRPIVISVGLPFLIVKLCSRDTLRRCVPNPAAYKATLPLDGAVSIYAYTRDAGDGGVQAGRDLQSRMFIPRMTEDPATGNATCATAAPLVATRSMPELTLRAQ